TRSGHIHALVLGSSRVADAREKIGNGIGLHNVSRISLPTRLHDAGNFSLERHATEANATHCKFANIGAGAAADTATIALAHFELGLLEFFYDLRGACH